MKTPLDFHCPVCQSNPHQECSMRGYFGETRPHASRAVLADHENAKSAERAALGRKRNAARAAFKEGKTGDVEGKIEMIFSYLELARWPWPFPELNAAGVFVQRTSLFAVGDPVLLSFTNGGGERAGASAWSSKKRCPIIGFYVNHTKHEPSWEWERRQRIPIRFEPRRNRAPVKFVELSDGVASLSPSDPAVRTSVIRIVRGLQENLCRAPVALE